MIFDIVPPKTEHDITLRTLLELVVEHGGDMDTALNLHADGEPVYIHAYTPEPVTPVTKCENHAKFFSGCPADCPNNLCPCGKHVMADCLKGGCELWTYDQSY